MSGAGGVDPVFLELADVLDLHADLIARFGGASGLRDPGLLQSALAMPLASFGDAFLHVDLFEMAAAYLFHLVKNHPFVDGNKRIGASAAMVFLDLNGWELDAPNDAFADFVLGIAAGDIPKSAIAEYLRRNVVPSDG